MRLLRFLLASTLIGCAARAQQPSQPRPPATAVDDPHAVQPERPTVATHAGTVAPGWLEIETGIERDRFSPAAVGYVTPTVLKVGLVDHVQLSITGSVAHPAPGITGLGDLAAGLKVRLFDNAPFIGDFAILPAVKLPIGSAASGTGTGTTDVSVLAISSHDVGRMSVDANVGYTLAERGWLDRTDSWGTVDDLGRRTSHQVHWDGRWNATGIPEWEARPNRRPSWRCSAVRHFSRDPGSRSTSA